MNKSAKPAKKQTTKSAVVASLKAKTAPAKVLAKPLAVKPKGKPAPVAIAAPARIVAKAPVLKIQNNKPQSAKAIAIKAPVAKVPAVKAPSVKVPAAKVLPGAAAKVVAAPPAKIVAAKPAAPVKPATSVKVSGKSQPAVNTNPKAVMISVAKGPAAVPPTKVNGVTKNGKSSTGRLLPPAPPVIIPAPVSTDGKPRKNQAGLHARDLEHFRELLLAKRRELLGDMTSMEREALRSTSGTNLSNLPMHMADMGTDNYEQEFTLGLVEKDRGLLREINTALGKIQNGTYGLCEGTGQPISKARLEAQPWAKYSIEYARELERRGMRR